MFLESVFFLRVCFSFFALFRIWDRMIGGSCYVMVYLAVAILIFFRRPLLSMKSSEDMVNYLKHVRKVVFD